MENKPNMVQSAEEQDRAPYVIGGIIVVALLLLVHIFLAGDDEEMKMKQEQEAKRLESIKGDAQRKNEENAVGEANEMKGGDGLEEKNRNGRGE